MLRRHRNILIKLIFFLSVLYFITVFVHPSTTQDDSAESIKQPEENVDLDVKVPEAKDVVLDVPDPAPKRDLNIQQPHLKDLVEDKIEKVEEVVKKPKEELKEIDFAQNKADENIDVHVEERNAMDIPEPKKAEDTKPEHPSKPEHREPKEDPKDDLDAKLAEAEEKAKIEKQKAEQPALQPPQVHCIHCTASRQYNKLHPDILLNLFKTVY